MEMCTAKGYGGERKAPEKSRAGFACSIAPEKPQNKPSWEKVQSTYFPSLLTPDAFAQSMTAFATAGATRLSNAPGMM